MMQCLSGMHMSNDTPNIIITDCDGSSSKVKDRLITSQRFDDIQPSRFAKSKEKTINLNVGGTLFRTTNETLSMMPGTILAEISQESPFYNANQDEYFFDRSPHYFCYILDCYRDGEIHVPSNICVNALKKELDFWGLGENCVSLCCRASFTNLMDRNRCNIIHKQMYETDIKKSCKEICLSEKIWIFLENPDSASFSKMWKTTFHLFLFMSIVSFFAATLPACRIDSDLTPFLYLNVSSEDQKIMERAMNSSKVKMLLTTKPINYLRYLDISLLVVFTLEFSVRLYACPKFFTFLKRAATMFDIVYLTREWLMLVIELIDINFWPNPRRISVFLILHAFIVSRVFRVIRFAPYNRGLRALMLAVQSSFAEFKTLFIFVFFAMSMYASIIYYTEIFQEQGFESVFMGLWWSLITMTTVGYGDYYPKTWAGYIVASFCAVTGLMVIGMPVSFIVDKFRIYYKMESHVR